MTDIQILTLALTVVVPFFGVLLGVLINNTRLTDVNTRMSDVKEVLRAEIRAESAELRKEMRDLSSLMERHHSEIMAKLIEMDNRILRLESQRLIQ
jgi:hypothetical protein